MNILVTGGAGYIGSHATKALIDLKHKVVVVDSLENGYLTNLDKRAKFFKVNINRDAKLKGIIKQFKIEAIFHFAAYKMVGESVEKPLKYYDNNVGASTKLLKAAIDSDVKYFIFSSSASVYGNLDHPKAVETDKMIPTSPYGKSKKMFEVILKDASKASSLKFVSLRYFNVAGYDMSGKIGTREVKAANLIPIVINAMLDKKPIQVFGNDYNTKDGSAIRDYIHVSDLVDAHIKALNYLIKTKESQAFNLGNSKGFSVKDILNITQKALKIKLDIRYTSRRAGDPEILIADSSKAKKLLKWKPQYGLEEMIVSTYKVFKK